MSVGRPFAALSSELSPARRELIAELRNHLAASGESVRAVSERAGLSAPSMSRLLAGRVQLSEGRLVGLCEALRLDASQTAHMRQLWARARPESSVHDPALRRLGEPTDESGAALSAQLASLREEAGLSVREIAARLTDSGTPISKSSIDRALRVPADAPLLALLVADVVIASLPGSRRIEARAAVYGRLLAAQNSGERLPLFSGSAEPATAPSPELRQAVRSLANAAGALELRLHTFLPDAQAQELTTDIRTARRNVERYLDAGPAKHPVAALRDTPETSQSMTTLYAAMAELPKRQREVLVLRYMGNLSISDIASQLDIGQASVRHILRRAKERLKFELAELNERTGGTGFPITDGTSKKASSQQRQAHGEGRGTFPPAAVTMLEEPSSGDGSGNLRELIAPARVVLFAFDGPICQLFAGHSAQQVASGLVERLRGLGFHGLLTEADRESQDPHVVLRTVARHLPQSDLIAELEERLTQEELRAAATAMPTPYADPLIRTWAAVGSRLAITTNNSPQAVRSYLMGRDLMPCFAPHVYGRTQDLNRLKPDPYCLQRALDAMAASPADTLVIGNSPVDHEAARRVGVPFLGYARNEHTAQLLREAGAGAVVSSLKAVLDVVRG